MKATFARRSLITAIAGATSAMLVMAAMNAQAARTVTLGHTLSDSSHYSVGADAFEDTLERL